MTETALRVAITTMASAMGLERQVFGCWDHPDPDARTQPGVVYVVLSDQHSSVNVAFEFNEDINEYLFVDRIEQGKKMLRERSAQ